MTQHNPSDPDGEVGAFGFPGDVDWEGTGFADDDLTGRPRQPKHEAAPRPAASATPLPSRPAPAMPHRSTPTAQPVTPPPPPAPPTAPAPAMPQVPAPVQPPPAPIPTAPLPQMGPQPPAPTPGPGYAPPSRASMEDLSPPEWSRIVPTIPEDQAEDPAFTTAPFEEPLYPTVGDPVLPDPSRGGKRRDRAPQPRDRRKARSQAKNPAKDTKAAQYAGGRWKIKLLRGLIYTVLAVLLAGGLKNVLTNDTPPTADQLAERVERSLGITEFPAASAEAFAVRFAREYLTYSQAGQVKRERRLALYSPAAAASEWGWDGVGKQTVITGPTVSAPTVVDGNNFGTVTVTAQVSTGDWVALAVPVHADENGSLVVAGAPAFVALPAQAINPGVSRDVESDDDLAASLSVEVLPGFLTVWAASDRTELDRYITPDATPAARTGLAGTVTFESVDNIVVPVGGKTRTGLVTVAWSAGEAGGFTQDYEVQFVQGTDKRWSIKDIRGGVVADEAAVAATNPDEEMAP